MVTLQWNDIDAFRVYNIKDGNGKSIYVGQSTNVIRRLYEHIRGVGQNASGVAEFANGCDTSAWAIDIYSLRECELRTGDIGRIAVDSMEELLIRELKPMLNKYRCRTWQNVRELPLGLTDNLY